MPQLLPERKKPPVSDNGDFSIPEIFASLGGGLAAAAVFAVVTKGTLPGLLLAHLAPLPILIVALAFGLRHGVTSAIIATGLLSIWPNPVFGLVYAFLIAVPAMAAAYAVSGAPYRRRELLTSHLPAWGVLAAGIALAIATSVAVTAAVIQLGSLDEALNPFRAKAYLIIEEMIRAQELGDRLDAKQLSGIAVYAFPATLSAYVLLMQSLNLWGAGQLTRASGLLKRPWPDIALDFVLPRAVTAVFVVAAGLAFLGELPGAVALVVAETLGLALALQGLAVVHALLRDYRASTLLFTIMYFAIGLLGWPIVLFTAIGAVDTAFALRSRKMAAQERRG
jgi:uncharacterized protein YybS (DUF2232 family)